MNPGLFISYFFLFIINSLFFIICYYFDFQFDIDLVIFISCISILTIAYHFLFFEKNLLSIINIFNSFSILFLYGNVINYVLFNIDSFHIYYLMEGINIPSKHFISSLFLINLGLSLINLVYLKFTRSDNGIILGNKIPKDIMVLYIITSFVTAVKYFLELKHISNIGYVKFYMNGLGDLNYYSPIIEYSHTFLIVFYSIILSYSPKKKIFIYISIIFCLLMMLNSLKGARVLFLLPFLFSLWYYFKNYSRLTLGGNYFSIITVSLMLVIGFNTLKASRLNEESSILNIGDLPSLILNETGSTQKLIAVFLSKRTEIDSNYPFVLEPILYPLFYINNINVYKGGHSEDLAKTRNSLNHKISFLLNPSYYLNGNAVGSSMFAESFQYGLPFFYLVMILFGRFLSSIQNITFNSKFIIFLPLLFNAAVFAARDSPFPNTWLLVKVAFVTAVFYFFRDILKYNSNSNRA